LEAVEERKGDFYTYSSPKRRMIHRFTGRQGKTERSPR